MRSVRVPVTQVEHTVLTEAARIARQPLATWLREHAIEQAIDIIANAPEDDK